MTVGRELVRAGMWRWSRGTGLERFELLRAGDEWVIRGVILVMAEVHPVKASGTRIWRSAEASYEVVCDGSWHTKRADVRVRDGSGERATRITLEDRRWYQDDRANETLSGCSDIDLEWSPSTNTLPIQRLSLAVGETSSTIAAAWVRFPQLTLEPLPREYERLAERSYRYTSGGGAFRAGIIVDEHGLVVDYEGGWQRVSDRE